jgi:hypothetical protein
VNAIGPGSCPVAVVGVSGIEYPVSTLIGALIYVRPRKFHGPNLT